MLAAALRAKVAGYIDRFAEVRDENGHGMVVRNGTAETRTVLTSAGAVEVTAPRVNDRRAAAKITDDEEELLAFYDYPAGHWVHLRTTNPIESTFATARLRTKVTKGQGPEARRAGDGVQADRVRAAPLADGQRPAPGRARRGRSDLRQRQACRAAWRGRPA